MCLPAKYAAMRIGTPSDHTYLLLIHQGHKPAVAANPAMEGVQVERPNRSGHNAAESRNQVLVVMGTGKFLLRLLALAVTIAALALAGGAGLRPF